jgi:signal transduction histidine kinase
MKLEFFLLGAALAAPLAALATWWFARRTLRRAKRLIDHARTRENLVELAKLTGGLAHEIKNPLSAIKLNLKLLAEDFEHNPDEVAQRNLIRLQRLGDQVQRLHDTLDDFLKFLGNQEMHPADADLRQVVSELIDFFRPQAQANHVVLRQLSGGEPVICRIDVGLIKQALLNLLINAVQAMNEGGELLVRLGKAGDRAVLEVIDTGPGIAPEARPRIFDAYFSTRPGGTGLGLPTTRRIIRQHDGDIQVDSEVGKGTRFIVTLPLPETQAKSTEP